MGKWKRDENGTYMFVRVGLPPLYAQKGDLFKQSDLGCSSWIMNTIQVNIFPVSQ